MLERVRNVFRRKANDFPSFSAITLTPIGYVENKVKSPTPDGWAAVESRVILKPELEPMLLGLGGYSHVVVVFWPHEVPEEVRGSKAQLHPRDDPQYPLMGVLATRSQVRPNPVLISAVPLLSLKANVLRVRGLDAINGTPVLDVKPYLPFADAIPDARIPDWVAKAQAWRQERR